MGSFVATTVLFFLATICIFSTYAVKLTHRVRVLERRINDNAAGILNNMDNISTLNNTMMALDQCSPDEQAMDHHSSNGKSGQVGGNIDNRDKIQKKFGILKSAFAEEKHYMRQYKQHINTALSEVEKTLKKAAAKETATAKSMFDKFVSTFDDLQENITASLKVFEMKQLECSESYKSLITLVDKISRDIEPVVNQHVYCHINWTRHNGFRYKHFSERQVTYAEAKEACAVCGGHVVDVQDEDEMTFIMDLAGPITGTWFKSFWLGATDTETENTWIWDRTGEEATYLNFRPDQPNDNTRKQQCLVAGSWSPHELWNDINCDDTNHYMCKY